MLQIGCSIQFSENSPFLGQKDIAAPLLFILWQCNRAGIEIQLLRILHAGRHMGVPVEQNVSLGQRRRVIRIELVTVGGKNQFFPQLQQIGRASCRERV